MCGYVCDAFVLVIDEQVNAVRNTQLSLPLQRLGEYKLVILDALAQQAKAAAKAKDQTKLADIEAEMAQLSLDETEAQLQPTLAFSLGKAQYKYSSLRVQNI